MIIARQSTARTMMVGPVIDADGVAVTGGVVGDFKISKNGGAPAALNGSATLTHRHTGFYSLALTASDLDTVGQAEITIDDTVNSCALKEITVIEEAVYDALYAASAAGYQVPIWAAANSTVNLSATTIKTATDVETDTADIQSRIPTALGANGNIKADVRDLLGTAWLTPHTAGTPDVNAITSQLMPWNVIANVNSQTDFDLTTSYTGTEYTNQLALIKDASSSAITVRRVTGWSGASASLQLSSAPNFTVVAGDSVKIIATPVQLDTIAGYLDTEVAAILAAVDTEVAAIKAKTDNLPTDPADASDIASSFSTVNSTLSTIAGYIDTEVASILAAVDTEVAAIKAKTDNLPSSPAAVGSAMTLAADSITASTFDESTAFPLKSADTGSTTVARRGADSDTLKSLSDQIDGVSGGGSSALFTGTFSGLAGGQETTDEIPGDGIPNGSDLTGCTLVVTRASDVDQVTTAEILSGGEPTFLIDRAIEINDTDTWAIYHNNPSGSGGGGGGGGAGVTTGGVIPLRQATGAQEVALGPFMNEGAIATGLTIANTDIKLHKNGATSLVNKNSGGATYMAGGVYYAVFDATDTATAGPLSAYIDVAGADPVRVDMCVYPANVFDSLVVGTDLLDVSTSGGGEGGSAADLATEDVPTSRTFILMPGATGLVSEDRKTIIAGEGANTYAVDFRNDTAHNQEIYGIESVEIVSGTEDGVTIGDYERRGTRAQLRLTGVTAGEYTVRVTVTYSAAGPTSRGDILIEVVD